jgi:hypothetical protein
MASSKKSKIQSHALAPAILEGLMPITTEDEPEDIDDDTPSRVSFRTLYNCCARNDKTNLPVRASYHRWTLNLSATYTGLPGSPYPHPAILLLSGSCISPWCHAGSRHLRRGLQRIYDTVNESSLACHRGWFTGSRCLGQESHLRRCWLLL